MNRMNPAIKTMLVSLWFGLLVVPFAGVVSASEVAAAVAAGLFTVMGLRAVMRTGVASGFRKSGAAISNAITSLSSVRRKRPALVVLTLLLCAFPAFADRYALDLAAQTGIYIVLALGLNIVVGQAGLLVLGYVAFYAVGAYTYAILASAHGVNFWAALQLPYSLRAYSA